MIVLKRGESARVIEDGHEFTAAASFTAGTDPRVTCAKVLLNVAQLLVEALLGADELRGLAPQQVAHDRAALSPGMRGAHTGIAEIERHYVQRDCLIRVRTCRHRAVSPAAAVRPVCRLDARTRCHHQRVIICARCRGWARLGRLFGGIDEPGLGVLAL
jgi:hypothetical protein